MMENENLPIQPQQPSAPAAPSFVPPARQEYSLGARELIFGVCAVIGALCLCNFTMFGGFHLGFALAVIACIAAVFGYLWAAGHKPTPYSTALLGLSVVIAASFARGDDGFVKFVMVCFLMVSIHLGLSLQAGKNLRQPDGVSSLLDSFHTFFALGFGKMPPALRGLKICLRSSRLGKQSTSVLLGVVIAVPVLAVLVPLLILSDAAFDGMVGLLPEFNFGEAFTTLFFGAGVACVLFAEGVALHLQPKQEKYATAGHRGLNVLTVNTVLVMVCGVYCVYLLSQLAYFVGGFAGILPEEFTVAEYARRGFFEMAWICVINLSVMIFAVSCIQRESRAPFSTRLLCAFIGVVTVFLVCAASAKMFLYIGSFGLTRLRVLTQVIMVFLGITTVLVCLWLFLPRLPYMKGVLLCALILGAAVSWADVDTVVASYNVSAYQSGRLETIDVRYLRTLGDGAIPYIARLTDDPDPEVAEIASAYLMRGYYDGCDDFRDWNYVSCVAEEYLTIITDDQIRER